MKAAPIICLMGPTAAGKTQLALELIQALPCEIISVDSAMIYRGMDIGTAKPTSAELAIAPHHLIDICDPSESYSAGQFRTDALRLIDDIQARQKLPLLVGGTMLYFKALQFGLSPLPSANAVIRNQITYTAEKIGWQGLHAKLAEIDPTAATRINPNDAQRIQRALEVYYVTGKSLTAYCEEHGLPALTFPVINIALLPSDRAVLHQRIATRFMKMLELGFVEEVRALYQRGDLHLDLPAMRAVGYRQVWNYLAGTMSYDEMIEKGITATRQLAKRQMTWLRSWNNVTDFDYEQDGAKAIMTYLSNQLNSLHN